MGPVSTSGRIRVEIDGIVQGVGFRPFIYRLAQRHGLNGWVCNTPAGVLLEAQGGEEALAAFLDGIRQEAPPLAVVGALQSTAIPSAGGTGFAIVASGTGEGRAEPPPDSDVCTDCLRELFDPSDRRYRYPFITCTNCGPRYSIISGIPYDRPLTTMAGFPLCAACRSEYEDPADRRFHAQPLACPVCGPRLRLVDAAGADLSGDPVDRAIGMLAAGRIVAVKGVGGYHLAVDAANGVAVAELRRRKRRNAKPLAMMVADVAGAAAIAVLDSMESRLLAGPERPIVLLRKRDDAPIAPEVAPHSGYFGIMLPASPVHHLLLADNRFAALVMTSGNRSSEPIAYREKEALSQLAGIADAFLVHDRGIRTRVDDSVIRVFRGNPLFLRRSRGYVPRAVTLPASQRSVLAVGAELKGACCLTRGDRAFMSQHIGDLQNVATLESLAESGEHLQRLLEIAPVLVAHDLHPDYLSTRFALERTGLPSVGVQHHHAHLAACMAENRLEGPTIGVIFDGTGLGADGTVWGGEFLVGDYAGYRRSGRFRQVPLPGGDAAIREPYRMALSWCHAALGEAAFALPLEGWSGLSDQERALMRQLMERRINAPLTSSCGRLFDAVAALLGVRGIISYEGQAAIELEALAEEGRPCRGYPVRVSARDGLWEVDWAPLIAALLEDLAGGVAAADMAASFHAAVVGAAVAVCGRLRDETGIGRVALSGGVFQNRLLTEGLCSRLETAGFTVHTHRLVPPNDGGLALGQAIIAGRNGICV